MNVAVACGEQRERESVLHLSEEREEEEEWHSAPIGHSSFSNPLRGSQLAIGHTAAAEHIILEPSTSSGTESSYARRARLLPADPTRAREDNQ